MTLEDQIKSIVKAAVAEALAEAGVAPNAPGVDFSATAATRPEGAPPAEPGELPVQAEALTLAEIRPMAVEFAKANGVRGREMLMDILAGMGAEKLTDLPEDQFSAFAEKVRL